MCPPCPEVLYGHGDTSTFTGVTVGENHGTREKIQVKEKVNPSQSVRSGGGLICRLTSCPVSKEQRL